MFWFGGCEAFLAAPIALEVPVDVLAHFDDFRWGLDADKERCRECECSVDCGMRMSLFGRCCLDDYLEGMVQDTSLLYLACMILEALICQTLLMAVVEREYSFKAQVQNRNRVLSGSG